MESENQSVSKLPFDSSCTSFSNEAKVLESQKKCISNNYQDIKNHLHRLRYSAYCDTAFWSNPAWLDLDHCSLYGIAVKQWIVHHRTWIAAKKVTIAQIIGGVRGVIPKSRLAQCGDYR